MSIDNIVSTCLIDGKLEGTVDMVRRRALKRTGLLADCDQFLVYLCPREATGGITVNLARVQLQGWVVFKSKGRRLGRAGIRSLVVGRDSRRASGWGSRGSLGRASRGASEWGSRRSLGRTGRGVCEWGRRGSLRRAGRRVIGWRIEGSLMRISREASRWSS
jgi:hypothetical protein